MGCELNKSVRAANVDVAFTNGIIAALIFIAFLGLEGSKTQNVLYSDLSLSETEAFSACLVGFWTEPNIIMPDTEA